MSANVINLVSECGTKYMIPAISNRIINVMQTAYDTNAIIDLAGAKFNPAVIDSIESNWLFSKLTFINSTDPEADAILKNNLEVRTRVYDEYPELQLSSFESIDSVIDFIQEHRQTTGEQYKLTAQQFCNYEYAVASLLIMALPNIEFDIRKCVMQIFDFVREQWCISGKHHESYLEVIQPNIRTVNQENGLYDGLSEDWFINRRIVLPRDFGTKELISFTGNVGVDEEWSSVAEKIYNTFDDATKTEEDNEEIRSVPLMNYLTLRKE